MKGRMLLSAMSLVALAATAQDQPRTEPAPQQPEPALRRYHVEVILFAHADANPNEEVFGNESRSPAVGARPRRLEEIEAAAGPIDPRSLDLPVEPERFGAAPERRARARIDLDPLDDFTPEPRTAQSDPFEAIDPLGRGRSAGSGATPFRFRLLRPDELRLNEEFRRMERLGAYRTLGHAGWVQEALDLESSRPMNLASLGVANPIGTIRLYVSRFLHLIVDLEYHAGRPLLTSEGETFDSFRLGELATRPRYEFHMERNAFRSGELQYIDHPMFGILVLITPAPEEVQDVQDDTSVLVPAA